MGPKYKEDKKDAPKADCPSGAVKKREFEFPSNVKQIGGLNKGIKIYIEDYAYTYISKLGAKRDSDSAAFLVGFLAQELGEDILVISGAIVPPFSSQSKDGQVFSDSDRQYANDIINKHFKGLEVVGWARLQPGYGLYLSASDISSHYLGFTDKHSVLFLCDPEEKLNCFFEWNENQDDLSEVSGYFIYYDKNREMNEYIAEVKRTMRQKPEKAAYKEVEAIEITMDEEMGYDSEALTRTVDNAKRIAEIHRQKRIISMMTSVSLLLFFACVIMGIGLLQSGERISVVETQLRELRTGYNNIVSRLNDSVYPAFASQTQSAPESVDGAGVTLTDTSVKTSEDFAEDNINLDEELGITIVNDTPLPPDTPDAPEASAEPTTYIVQQGDTLTSISQKFYGSTKNIDAIMSANGITNPDTLMVGAKLIIP